MSQQVDQRPARVSLAAFIDEAQRRKLVELAQREDRTVSSIVRRALQAELERQGFAA